MNNRTKIEAISFMRVLCAIGIVVYHFNGAVACEVKPFYQTANGWWGTVLVTIFFAISGAVLYFNYPCILNIKAFYWKRFKSIYPAFYLCFLYFFIQNVLKTGSLFYKGNPASILLSVFALDGYFYYLIPTYYQVGEWFLGAIVLLYLFYPLIIIAFRRIPIILSVIVCGGYITVLFTHFFQIDLSRNIITCLFSFLFGMIAIKNLKLITKKGIVLGAGVLALLLIFIPIPINSNLIQHILGFSLFIILFGIGKYVMRLKRMSWVVKQLDTISYPIFLFQHMIIDTLLQFRNPTSFKYSILWCIITLIYTIICAKILSIIVNAILDSKIVKKIDTFMLKENPK